MKNAVKGILCIYHHPQVINASTIMEHIRAFERHSQFKVFSFNTLMGFPGFLENFEFSVIVLHYSLFGLPILMPKGFIQYVANSRNSYKIAFLQDEHRYWPERASFLNRCGVDCVYSLLEEKWFNETYLRKTNVKRIFHNIPGYVSIEIEEKAKKYYKPDSERTIDVGYRGRRLPYYMGRASQEKHIIGIEFKRKAKDLGLKIDIETEENKRIYGEGWYLFLANCKSTIGVEAGVSIFDIEDEVRPRYTQMVKGHPDVSFPNSSFEEVYEQLLKPYEDKIYYRTISPRHFEAAAFRNCQILFEGKYSGIMEPMKHYIPLKKDFSNFDTVIRIFKNKNLRKEITDNAYKDLIESGKYTYKRFIEDFDQNLIECGIKADVEPETVSMIERYIERSKYDIWNNFALTYARIRGLPFPGRKFIRPILKPIFKKLGI